MDDQMDDLIAYAESVIDLLTQHDSRVLLDCSAVSCARQILRTEQICWSVRHHDYDNFRVDTVHGYGTRTAWRALGVWLVGCFLHKEAQERVIEFAAPGSRIRRLVVQQSSIQVGGLEVLPAAVLYERGQVARHPWASRVNGPQHVFPYVALEGRDVVITEAERLARDQLTGFGSAEGLLSFAELLLNFGHEGNTQDEVALEHVPGVQGVAFGSTELVLWLPGSFGWDDDCFAMKAGVAE